MDSDKKTYKTRETLLEKLKNKHDEESWEDFVFYYKGFIYVICRRMNLAHHDADELVQVVLLSLWGSLPNFKYDKKQKFRNWLCQVTKNHIKNFFRSSSRHSTKIEKASKAFPKEKGSLPDIEMIAEEEWNTYIANLALINIKDDFSEVVLDVFRKLSKGGTISSVSEEMDIPPNTVSVYKKRVIARLRKEIRLLNHELG